MANALANVRPTHLLDLDVQRAWRERSKEIRPAGAAPTTTRRFGALPVLTSEEHSLAHAKRHYDV
jgi:hypothetical protein